MCHVLPEVRLAEIEIEVELVVVIEAVVKLTGMETDMELTVLGQNWPRQS